ncbi:zinc finger MYM-type protein 1-like [Aphis craccivora]|uniref:Zinc finger MYM-type protein 1-like n=1 Tax=Aphis craccivora TaxID=307492 RepID=A0A6G0ZBV0_APHCR|nr:zinc finger MYM-type protein 1-like [Aphis craccivora]
MCISAWLDNNKIFINERLTKDRRSLFGKARTKQFQFVWVHNGNILMKKDEKSKTLRIKANKTSIKLYTRGGEPIACQRKCYFLWALNVFQANMASINNICELLDSDNTSLHCINEINESLSKHNNNFNILHTNIRIASEAWIGKDFNPKYFSFCKGFNIKHTKNNLRRSDGVVIFIKNDIIHNTTESPNGDINTFLTQFNIVITNIINNHKNSKILILWNLNINLLDTTQNTTNHIDILNSLNFTSHVNIATRPDANTCLDHKQSAWIQSIKNSRNNPKKNLFYH